MLPFGPILVALTGAAIGTYEAQNWLKHDKLNPQIAGYNAQGVIGLVGAAAMLFMGGVPALIGAATLGASAAQEMTRRSVVTGMEQLQLRAIAQQSTPPALSPPAPDVVVDPQAAGGPTPYDQQLSAYWA